MRTHRRWSRSGARVIVVVALLSLVLAACGDDDGGGADATDTTSATTTETTAASTTSSTTGEGDEGPASFDVFLLEDDTDECDAAVGVPREATVEGAPADALAQLLAGPTPEEEQQGLRSWFSEETEGMLHSVVVTDGVAEVDFDDFSGIIPNASTSCGSAGLLAQLDRTILQFPEIEEAVYSFEGDRDAFYEWLQRSAPE
jgi:spore germination protein GerM